MQASRTFLLNFLVSKVINNKCLWDWRGIFVVEHCLVCPKHRVHPWVLQQIETQHTWERDAHCLLHPVNGTVTAAWSRVRRKSGVQHIPWELLLGTQMETANRIRQPRPNQILIRIMQYRLSPLSSILSRKTLWFWVTGTGQILDRQQALEKRLQINIKKKFFFSTFRSEKKA